MTSGPESVRPSRVPGGRSPELTLVSYITLFKGIVLCTQSLEPSESPETPDNVNRQHAYVRYWTTLFEDLSAGITGLRLHQESFGQISEAAEVVVWDANGGGFLNGDFKIFCANCWDDAKHIRGGGRRVVQYGLIPHSSYLPAVWLSFESLHRTSCHDD